jgi:hypothetical protein
MPHRFFGLARFAPSAVGMRLLAATALAACAAALALIVAVAADASPPRPLTLDLHGHLTGPDTLAGTWQAVGAFSDAGTYTETFRFAGRSIHVKKTLVGTAGTLRLRAEARVIWATPTTATFKSGNWRITSGTGAYRHLHAGGTPAATPDSFGDLATELVHIEHVGSAH